MPIQGLLLVDKPKTWTSFDVVNYIRRIVATVEGKKPKNCKVGHTGTLDPLATGLLILLIGKEYTRRAGELSKLDKTYEVTMKLGETSTTADDEGEKTVVSDTIPSERTVREALQSLQGQIMQVPPAYSAMKINGQRAYKLAREGKLVELEARPVTIHFNTLTSYDYPFVKFTSRVSSGTYIRSLVTDLGKMLETGAYMSDLSRTSIANYQLTNAIKVDDIDQENITNLLERLEPMEPAHSSS
ncbi:tRNA pseudouridine(55) synthase TruB [Aeromicrobium sp.]|nr:tRNA pseudouridine(55) synthase TruB [Candidatus Saccharibacteria bacterium]